jgi:lipopolysaccharide/colanic/teichoic acid biosynthesis glycosyltransferase
MYERWGKRAFDLAGAALLLVALAPAWIAVALLVRARLGSPVLFVQLRAGQDGRPFRLLKFRSMRIGPGSDAERLDGFGVGLRRTGLDERPQIVNVLRGEMSLVGPRPLPVEYLPRYSVRQAQGLRAKPGIAGPGVAAGRNAVEWAERLEIAARYSDAAPTLAGDLRLIAGTLRIALSGRGAAAPGHATMPVFRGDMDQQG